MKRLNVAIIGQGRSGRDIHSVFLKSDANKYWTVKYIVDFDAERREKAQREHEGCIMLSDYTELFDKDVDLVVNASYSDMHFPITKDLLEHGKNVLVEKPLARSRYECDLLERAAKENGVILAAFQNTTRAPWCEHVRDIVQSGVLGEVLQVSLRFNNYSRRWDWQTMQRKLGGNLYNMGPHAIGVAMEVLGYDSDVKVAYSKLASAHSSGDAEDYVKFLLTAENKPLVDVEINYTDAYANYNVKIQGTRGAFKGTTNTYEYKYYTDEENPPKALIVESMKKENGDPDSCKETLVWHEEKGEYEGTAFDIGTRNIYEDIYFAITEGKPLVVTPAMAKAIVTVMETIHAENPMEMKY
jgi:predicted dehydrogenase